MTQKDRDELKRLDAVVMEVGSEYFDHTVNKIETFLANSHE